MSDVDLPALPDDISRLLDQARPHMPAVPPGVEAAVLAQVTATTATTAATSGSLGAKLAAGAAKLGAAKIAGGIVVAAIVTTGVVVATQSSSAPPARSSYVSPVGPGVPSAAARSLAFARERAAAVAARPQLLPSGPAGNQAIPQPAEPPHPGESGDSPGRGSPAPRGSAAFPAGGDVPEAGNHAIPQPADAPPAPPEEQLLGDARDALARGDGDVALKKLQQDASAYPHGRLVEERRALTVVAFAQKGDKARAASAARAFEREYPQSLFLETVRSAVGP